MILTMPERIYNSHYSNGVLAMFTSYPLLISTGVFEISIRTEKKFQLELKKKFSYKLTEKKFQLVYN